jgi:hypothetical protein
METCAVVGIGVPHLDDSQLFPVEQDRAVERLGVHQVVRQLSRESRPPGVHPRRGADVPLHRVDSSG